MLRKGSACFECRKHKVRCNGLKPTCTRCKRVQKDCAYAAGIAKRTTILEHLEARAVALELKLFELSLPGMHDLTLVSTRLLERLGHLGTLKGESSNAMWLPIYPGFGDEPSDWAEAKPSGMILEGDMIEGYYPLVGRAVIEQQLKSYNWEGMEDLPPPLSRYLICLFLPHRSQYHFFVDVPYFLHCVSLPPSHPQAIHPCFLNACYLAACACAGGVLASLQPIFIQRTRHFLQQSLMFSDRLDHFLWGSLLLGAYFARARRSDEAFVALSSTARFASACGLAENLELPVESNSDPRPRCYLLPPPKNGCELTDRIRFAHSAYLIDQSLTILSEYPAAFDLDDGWKSLLGFDNPLSDHGLQALPMTEANLDDIWTSDIHMKVSLMRLFERVKKFGISHATGCSGTEAEFLALGEDILRQHASIPPLSDPRGLQTFEVVSTFNPHLLLVHTTLYGSGLILWSLRAHEDIVAQGRMLEYLRALVAICKTVRDHGPPSRTQASVISMVHVRNAVRVIARQLQRAGIRENVKLSLSYYSDIESLLDFIEGMTAVFPTWADVPTSLKDTLTAAAKISL
ncbi:hypothetical protein DL93DRAFT_1711760 [Clavulina sp. PMI_390]|nr:hypothetical protein DL93DRAFT_1711760 [Clavulina sp. PMI_390]